MTAASRAIGSAAGLSPSGMAFFGGLCVGTLGLGGWQTQRYFEKVQMVERREKELAMAPVKLEPHATMAKAEFLALRGKASSSDGDDGSSEQQYRRVFTQGHFRHEDEILIGPRGPPLDSMGTEGPMSGRSAGGLGTSPMGYFVVTPLVRSQGEGTILVNRGWIPMLYEKQSYEWERPTGQVQVVGVTTQAEVPKFFSPEHTQGPGKLLWFDRNAMEEQTNTQGIAPLIVTETTTTTTTTTNNHPPTFPVKPLDTTVGEFKVLPSTHAGYAATWFGLSGAGMIMTRKMILRGRG